MAVPPRAEPDLHDPVRPMRVLVVTNVVSAIVTSTTLFIAWRLRPPRVVAASDVVDHEAPVGGNRP